MLGNFFILAEEVLTSGGTISFGWPRYCVGWNTLEVKSMIDRFNLKPAFVDGCAVGVVDVKGVNKIKKPWCFVCSDPLLVQKLDSLRCNKDHKHVPCAGKNTLQTGFYPKP
jgi:hypothetical protein